jgi:2',3'-cyclic-nucleotide 2'-phosphodiesterase / 3'-nucleotidase
MLLRCLLLFLLALAARAQTARIRVLGTTDMHGHGMAWDYYQGREANLGLAKLATLIRAERSSAPDAVLIDNGDTIQGTPMETLHGEFIRTGRVPKGLNSSGLPRTDPMMQAMNALGYVALTVGNHEFNYGLKVLEQARTDARFPFLSANTVARGGVKPFLPFVRRKVQGVDIAIVGLTTTFIPQWEKPENFAGYLWDDPVERMRLIQAGWRNNPPDIVIASVHAGIDKEGRSRGENIAWQIAELPGIHLVLCGHTHQEVEGERSSSGAIIVQPKNYAASLAVADFTLSRDAKGKWRVDEVTTRLSKVKRETPADPEMVKIFAPWHRFTEAWLASPVTNAPVELSGTNGRREDSALVDAIHAVQLHYTQADVSLTALFQPSIRIAAGAVRVREAAALYVYDNELYKVETTGAALKAALENAARFYQQCTGDVCKEGPQPVKSFPGFNFDIAQGVEYEIDLRQPEGQRIVNLRRKGKPVLPDDKLTLAVNNYRYGGSGGYEMLRSARLLQKYPLPIRDLLIDYYSQNRPLPAKPDHNWRLVY